ncbi:unnamed protein product [marine sediment metagenome]|uniref:Uncharacterized protein n=1 Tax=marine sediment metagenome TaxID=412755 RepID=X0UL50_9ZZZZ
MYEVWWVEDDLLGTTAVSKVDECYSLQEAKDTAEEFENALQRWEGMTVHTAIKHEGGWVG